MDVGAMLLRALCTEQNVYSFFNSKIDDGFFFGQDEKDLFKFVQEHANKYHALPSILTLEEQFQGLPEVHETAEFYLDKVEERYAYRTLNKGLTQCNELLKGKDIQATIDAMTNMTGHLIELGMRQQIVEFSQEGKQIVLSEYQKKKLQGAEYGILFGWPYLDQMVGGLGGGDVVSYVGRPAVGKTYKMLYTAHNAWFLQNKNVLFVSMEMSPVPLIQRVAAMHTHTSITDIKNAELPNYPVNVEKNFFQKLSGLKDHGSKFWIVDGNLTSTVREVAALCHQLKPDVVVIDGAYLLAHENARLDRYVKVAENIELIKRICTRMGIPAILSYQFNRQAAKKKDSKEVGLDDIGYSDAIGQTSSIVLGLFEEENVSTFKSRMINILKGREGATGSFSVMWDFKNMNFSEIPALVEKEDLKAEYI